MPGPGRAFFGARAPGVARLLALLLAGCVCACAGAQDGNPPAPFITTPDEVVERMLVLAGTGREDFVVDLGSGDGRIVQSYQRIEVEGASRDRLVGRLETDAGSRSVAFVRVP